MTVNISIKESKEVSRHNYLALTKCAFSSTNWNENGDKL
jgi:hypothetical protein